MNAIRNVFAAFANLASSLNGLAALIDSATGRLRQQLAVEMEPPQLPHEPVVQEEPAAEVNGTNGTARRGRKVG